MHKELHILGLLLRGPLTGYAIHRIVVAHGELYTDLKKGNVYYLLDRMAAEGWLQVTTETGARGRRGERLLYAITDPGRQRFHELLRAVVRSYEVAHNGAEVGIVFLPYLPPAEAMSLLEERRTAVWRIREIVTRDADAASHASVRLANDHLVSLMDAELGWIARALDYLREQTRTEADPAANSAVRCPGAADDDAR
jgi:DNA-binding PadR family transcriptional regulator